MKAIVFDAPGGAEVLKVKEVKQPEPGENEVLVKVHAIGVNPVETYIRASMFGPVPTPHILGSDCAGEVEGVGENVKRFKKGDRVWTCHLTNNGAGTYAEFVSVPEENVYQLPDNTSYKHGAALGIPFLTAAQALFQLSNSKPGETVLIHGASGGVGLPAVMFAKNHGMKVIGTASTEDGIQLVKEAGAHHVFNHRSKDYVDQIKEVTGGNGPNVIIEMLANSNLQKDMDMIATLGRIVIIGNRGKCEVDASPVMTKMLQIRGVLLFIVPKEEMNENAARISTGLEMGWLKASVGKEYTMEQAAEAHREQIEGKAKGKIIINVR
ncbi:quinone oxidoreductase-like [Rhopilema esculentum]|uniref:quinone oxidoreductase-like n=1 Tax=Rhopilema esculentum TaxID=499914 RepID=UPI0031D534DA|eukprot:gene10805-19610_t